MSSSISSSNASNTEAKNTNTQPFSIHYISISRIKNATQASNTSADVDLKDLIERVIKVYNTSKNPNGDAAAARPYELIDDFNAPDWSGLSSPAFNLTVYSQVVPIQSRVTSYLSSLGSKRIALAQRVNYIFFMSRFRLSAKTAESAEIFALTTGDGWRVTQKFSDYEFPYKIARRLLDSTKILRTKERHLVGDVLMSEKTFKHTAQLEDILDTMFPNVNCSFRADASLYHIEHYRNKNGSTRKFNAELGLGFVRMHTDQSLERYPQLLHLFSKIVNGEQTLSYSSDPTKQVVEVDSKEFEFLHHLQPTDFSLVPSLEKALIMALWNTFSKGDPLPLDFCHKEAAGYFQANSFQLMFQSKTRKQECATWTTPLSATEMILLLKNTDAFKTIGDYQAFEDAIAKVSVSFYSKGRNISAPFKDYFEGEVRLAYGKSFWRIRTMWFTISRDYLSHIHGDFVKMLQNSLIPTKKSFLKVKWLSPSEVKAKKDALKAAALAAQQKSGSASSAAAPRYDTEGEYNQRYLAQPKWILGDKICVQGIELFDLLHYDDQYVYLVHVKEGFGQKTRDVCSQIRNSARLIHDDLRHQGATKHLKDFYAMNRDYSGTDDTYRKEAKDKLLKEFPTEAAFLELFSGKRKIAFVYALIDDSEVGCKLLEEEKNRQLFASYDDIRPIYKNDDTIAKEIWNILVTERFIEDSGELTSKFFSVNQTDFVNVMSSKTTKKQTQTAHKNLYKLLSNHCSRFSSNIARLELLNLRREFSSSLGYELKICQIMRTDYPDKPHTTLSPTNSVSSLSVSQLPVVPVTTNTVNTKPGILTVKGKKYKVASTCGDGACGLHALLGTKATSRSQYFYNDARPNMQAALNKGLNPTLQALLHEHLHNLALGNSDESKLVFNATLRADFNKTVKDPYETALNKLRKEVDDLHLQILKLQNPSLEKQLLSIFRKESQSCNVITSDQELTARLLAEKDLRGNAFGPSHNEIIKLLPKTVGTQLKAALDKIDNLQADFSDKTKTFVAEAKVTQAYMKAIMDKSYFFSDLELRIAANLFNKKVVIIPGDYGTAGAPPLIEDGTGDEVLIYHSGAHYSRCEEVK